MVNKVVFDYLSQYHDKYNLDDLKKKILSAGYPQQDIDEAIKLLGLDNSLPTGSVNMNPYNSQVSAPNTNNNLGVGYPSSSGITNFGTVNTTSPSSSLSQQPNYGNLKLGEKKFKWMRFAGILGGIYLLIGILLGVFSYLGCISFNNNVVLYSILGVFALIFISVFFFLYGFVVMGKYSDSGLLRFASKSYIILVVIGVLIIIGMGVIAVFMIGDIVTEVNSVLSIINGNPLLLFSSLGGLGEILAKYALIFISLITLAGFWILFFIVASFCFFIGLMQTGNHVKFAKIAGLLGILVLVIFFALVLLFAGIATFNPEMLMGTDWGLVASIGVIGILALLAFSYIFMVISLFNASRKFESGYI